MGFYVNGQYHIFTDSERREYGERKRAERSKQWREMWITRTTLKHSWNWTDAAITKFLGQVKLQKAGSGRFGVIKAYLIEDIKTTETNSSEFQEWMEQRIWKQYQRNNDLSILKLDRSSYASKVVSKHYE